MKDLGKFTKQKAEEYPIYCDEGHLAAVISTDSFTRKEKEERGLPTDPRDYPRLVCPECKDEE
jgi:hypothetical protein